VPKASELVEKTYRSCGQGGTTQEDEGEEMGVSAFRTRSRAKSVSDAKNRVVGWDEGEMTVIKKPEEIESQAESKGGGENRQGQKNTFGAHLSKRLQEWTVMSLWTSLNWQGSKGEDLV